MTHRLPILAMILAGFMTLVGCAVLIGGLWFAFSTLSATNAAVPGSGGPNELLTVTASGSAVRVGSPAPDFTLIGIDQQKVELGQLRGKAVLLNFWATWCGPCSAEMSNIEQVFQSLSHADVAILAVNELELPDEVRGYADLYHLHFPILLDDHGNVGNAYHVLALPTTVFVDRNGIIREIHIGGPMSQDYIRAQIQSLLRQSP